MLLPTVAKGYTPVMRGQDARFTAWTGRSRAAPLPTTFSRSRPVPGMSAVANRQPPRYQSGHQLAV